MKKRLSKIVIISTTTWLACIFGVFAILGYVVGVRKEMFDKAPDVFAFSLLGLVLLGCLAFLVGVTSFTAQILIKRSQKRQNLFLFLMNRFLRFCNNLRFSDFLFLLFRFQNFFRNFLFFCE